MSIPRSLDSAADLLELAHDVGVQLGRGHAYLIADPYGRELREELLRSLDATEPRIEQTAEVLARATTEAWARFRRASR